MGLLSAIGSYFGPVGSVFGSIGDYFLGKDDAQSAAKRDFDRNAALQREFAQKGIQWKVADAKAAGVHPLYALGAQTHSFSPVAIGSGPGDMSSLGQDLSRALNAGSTQEQRDQRQVNLANSQMARMNELKLSEQEMKNSLLAAELMGLQRHSINQPPLPDAMSQGAGTFKLIPGQNIADVKGLQDVIKAVPSEVVAHDSRYPERTAGSTPAFSRVRLANGSEVTVPSKFLAESTEDMALLRYLMLGNQWLDEGIRGFRNRWDTSPLRWELDRRASLVRWRNPPRDVHPRSRR